MKKDEQIRMLLHPEKYTDEQLDQMLDESNIPVPDAMEEWATLSERINMKSEDSAHRTPLHSHLRKIAALFVVLLALSGITYAAIHLFRNISQTKQEQTTSVATADTSAVKSAVSPAVSENDSTLLAPVVFEDTELCTILSQMSTYYDYQVIYRSENAKHTRLYFTWDKTASIEDVVATFNKFERFHITIDNHQLIVTSAR